MDPHFESSEKTWKQKSKQFVQSNEKMAEIAKTAKLWTSNLNNKLELTDNWSQVNKNGCMFEMMGLMVKVAS